MLKVNFFGIWFFVLLLNSFASSVFAKPVVQSFEGFWVYGFEQSVLETCEGKRYWMWTPDKFKGSYKMEGFKNPVRVTGHFLPPNPDDNIYSGLVEVKVINIKNAKGSC